MFDNLSFCRLDTATEFLPSENHENIIGYTNANIELGEWRLDKMISLSTTIPIKGCKVEICESPSNNFMLKIICFLLSLIYMTKRNNQNEFPSTSRIPEHILVLISCEQQKLGLDSPILLALIDFNGLSTYLGLFYVLKSGLVGFYGISTIVGDLMPNPVFTYILKVYDL